MSVYVSQSNVIVSDDTFRDLTKQLQRLGSGVSRTVYDLGDGTVIKLQTGNYGGVGGNRSEYLAWQSIKDGPYAEHFAEVLACSDTGEWLIMRAVSETMENHRDRYHEWWDEIGCEISRAHNIGDLHLGNVGMTVQGNILLIDYACNEYEGNVNECSCDECNVQSSPEPCNCGEHDCTDCFPDGCNCEELQGCREEECDVCIAIPAARQGYNRDAVQVFFFEGERMALCDVHRIDHVSVREGQIRNEAKGQGVMVNRRIVSGIVREVAACL